MSVNNKNLILGIGTSALSDLSAGLKIIRYILRQYPDIETIAKLYNGRLDRKLVLQLERVENLIIFDAATLNHKPGTVCCLVGNKMDEFFKQLQRTAYETALAEILKSIILNEANMMRRALITIEPRKTSWGNRLSSPVSKAIPAAVHQAISLLCDWSGIDINSQIRN